MIFKHSRATFNNCLDTFHFTTYLNIFILIFPKATGRFRTQTFKSSPTSYSKVSTFLSTNLQKQPPRSVLRKRCSENMQQIYRRALIPKCDFYTWKVSIRPFQLRNYFLWGLLSIIAAWLLYRVTVAHSMFLFLVNIITKMNHQEVPWKITCFR